MLQHREYRDSAGQEFSELDPHPQRRLHDRITFCIHRRQRITTGGDHHSPRDERRVPSGDIREFPAHKTPRCEIKLDIHRSLARIIHETQNGAIEHQTAEIHPSRRESRSLGDRSRLQHAYYLHQRRLRRSISQSQLLRHRHLLTLQEIQDIHAFA